MIYLLLYVGLGIGLREIFFRLFFIYPKTSLNGWLSRRIEQEDLQRFVMSMYKCEERNAVFIGNSHVMDAIDPGLIRTLTSKSTYNFCYYYLPIPNMIKLALDNNLFPKLIFIDFSTRYAMFNSDYSNFGNSVELRKFDMRRERLLNFFAYFFPSIFVPRKFFFIGWQFLKKVLRYSRGGMTSMGRYSPFKLFIGYNWSLDLRTNHRIVKRWKSKSSFEVNLEKIRLKNSIDQTKNLCRLDSPDYRYGFQILREYVEKAISLNSRVVFMRMPMDKQLIDYENEHCSFYFNQLIELAKSLNCDYIDFNKMDWCDQIQFYTDGQHVDHHSSQIISSYIAKTFLL